MERDYKWLGEAMIKHYHGDEDDVRLLMAAVGTAFEAMTIDEYSAEIMTWLRAASHPS